MTGGANGIGRAVAMALAEYGANVFITTKADLDAAEETVSRIRDIGREASYISMEASSKNSSEVLFREAEERLGPISILVNNAATVTRTSFLNMDMEEYKYTQDVNLMFPYFNLQRFARSVLERGGVGSAINISSISAYKAISRLSAYQCSKAGISMLTKGAAYELAEFGIRVNSISPGLTATKGNMDQWKNRPDMWLDRGKDLPLRRAGIPSDFAGAAVFLASRASEWMTGADIVIDGGDSVV